MKLYFVGSQQPTLFQTEFAFGEKKVCCVRGKTSGAFPGRGSFHWSSAVRGMSLLAIQTVMASFGFGVDPVIFGEQGSLAASLDYALSKETDWLIDIFGVSEGANPNFRRLFKRTNSGRKRSGPVAVSFSKSLQERGAIEILLNGAMVTGERELQALITSLSSPCKARRVSEQFER